VDRNLLFLPVERIEPSRAHVYDLTVPGTHSFVANGFVNHNTYLAVAQAVSSLLAKSVARIVLARPAVEAGEKLGFLPGDLQDKVDPYLRPLYDALYDLLDYEKVSRLLERNAIEVAPIAFMRGRTLNDAFVIIDEAQNTTTEQMKMVLTRIGFGSKVVITGDITQIDLPRGLTSGLVEAIAVLQGVSGISFVYFDEKDVVRHRLVQSVIKAYEAYGAAQTQTTR
jgi:phosphate starvation-inducible PhoH-like protein